MFLLTVTTVNEILFRGSVRSLTAPGTDGQLTVLPHHAPLVTTLHKGVLRIQTQEEQKNIPVTHGILEVAHNEAIVLL